MKASTNLWWGYFLAISLPFLAMGGFEFAFNEKTYWDRTDDESLYLWLWSSMGWAYSHWPFLFYNAGPGFGDHYPSIPQSQIAALYGALGEWPKTDFQNFANIGLAAKFILVLGVAAWGATVSRRINAPIFLLFCSAALTATQPGMIFTWSSYFDYMILLLPIGISIFCLGLKSDYGGYLPAMTFFAIGYCLSIQNLAAIPILAIALATLASSTIGIKDHIFTHVSLRKISPTLCYVYLFSAGILLFGFVALSSGLPRLAAHLITDDGLLYLFLGAAIFGVGLLTLIYFYQNCIHQMLNADITRFFLFSAGQASLGWFVGVNLLAVTAWHRRVFSALKYREDTDRGWSVISLLEFLTTTRYWLWTIILITVVVISIVTIKTIIKKSLVFESVFVTFFIIAVIGINFYAMPINDEFFLSDSAVNYGASRYLSSIVVAIPVALLSAWKINPKFGHLAGATALLISVLSVVDYQKHIAPIGKKNRQIQALLDEEVKRFKKEYRQGRVVCNGSRMYRQCFVDYTYQSYASRHVSDKKNSKLPSDFGDPENQVVHFKDPNCRSISECFDEEHNAYRPILMISQNKEVPDAILRSSIDWHPVNSLPKDIRLIVLN